MGNDNNNNKHGQIFTNTCHPGLLDCHYDPNLQSLYKVVKTQSSILDWYNDIYRLQLKTHLFLPTRIADHQDSMQVGCCAPTSQLNPQVEFKQITYPAFFYTLEKEILSRRKEKSYFREWQLWKLIIFMAKGCIEWQQVYPNESLGVICSQNVVINSHGLIKLVCKISFYEQVYNTVHSYYIAPQSDPNSIIKYTFNPNCQPIAVQSASIYSIGKTLLEAATLVPAIAQIDLEQRLIQLNKTLYSVQLKQMLQRMLREDQSERPGLVELLKYAKLNRRKYQ